MACGQSCGALDEWVSEQCAVQALVGDPCASLEIDRLVELGWAARRSKTTLPVARRRSRFTDGPLGRDHRTRDTPACRCTGPCRFLYGAASRLSRRANEKPTQPALSRRDGPERDDPAREDLNSRWNCTCHHVRPKKDDQRRRREL